MARKIFYYSKLTDDLVQSQHQDYQLPDDYQWQVHGKGKFLFQHLVRLVALLVAFVYIRLIWGVRIIDHAKLKDYQNQGYVVYGNHTQPVNDVFIPFFNWWVRELLCFSGSRKLGPSRPW